MSDNIFIVDQLASAIKKPDRPPPFSYAELLKRAEEDGKTALEFAALVWNTRNPPRVNGKKTYNPMFQAIGYRGNRPGAWTPAPAEVRSCCQEIHPPHPKYPWTYKVHCKSVIHVAHLFNVDTLELKRYLGKTQRPLHRCTECHLFRKADDYLCKTCREALTAN